MDHGFANNRHLTPPAFHPRGGLRHGIGHNRALALAHDLRSSP
jgi:hypothetical protein